MSVMRRIGQALGLVRRRATLLVIGLDNSGKTSILRKLNQRPGGSNGAEAAPTPTVGFKEETLEYRGGSSLRFEVFDMSGQSRYRTLWEQHYGQVDAIIFVIDSTDKLRMCQVQDELETLLENEAVREQVVPLLFYCNKMDLPSAMTPVECVAALELEQIRDKPWHIEASNALSGEGLENGIVWLAENLLDRAEAKK